MEINLHPVTNTTLGVSDAHGAVQQSFSWQNPSFPMPSPRVKASSSDRVPGSVHSSRPRWTPAKHARILAEIKATRTDIDPSFPRPVPVPQSAGQASVSSHVNEAVGGLAQTTKSYFFGLTEYAVEQIYGHVQAQAVPGSNHAVTGTTQQTEKNPADAKKFFVETLVAAGASPQQAEDAVIAWTIAHLPLNFHTLPTEVNSEFVLLPSDLDRSGASRAHIFENEGVSGVHSIYKCYPSSSPPVLKTFDDLVGIDSNEPKRELRVLLASHIAHEMLKWDITPRVTIMCLGGRPCIKSPYIKGYKLQDAFDNYLWLKNLFGAAWEGDTFHPTKWAPHFKEGFQHDYIRLTLFSMLLGDIDRHWGQYLICDTAFNSLKGLDWDGSFGRKILNDEINLMRIDGQYRAFWPDSVPKKIADEFCALTDQGLKEAALAFGMSAEEAAALLSRFGVVKAKLAKIKKT